MNELDGRRINGRYVCACAIVQVRVNVTHFINDCAARVNPDNDYYYYYCTFLRRERNVRTNHRHCNYCLIRCDR